MDKKVLDFISGLGRGRLNLGGLISKAVTTAAINKKKE